MLQMLAIRNMRLSRTPLFRLLIWMEGYIYLRESLISKRLTDFGRRGGVVQMSEWAL
jgi:hypothetical protein